MSIFDVLFKKRRISQVNRGNEFCPRCDANLTLQKGYSNDTPYWICKGCGEMLINPRVETDTEIVWICDQCEAMLNEQSGFSDDFDKWICTECGFVNKIDESVLYSSDEEYQLAKTNPYLGMSDGDLISLMSYEEIGNINDREDISLVSDSEKLYVKKILSTFNESIYEHLISHPIANMPQIYEKYRGDRHLVIIEEYIEGCTLSQLLLEDNLSEFNALSIAKDLCMILNELHSQETPIIHRDIKPSNIMISKEGKVVLLDVNAAKWYDPEEIEDTTLLGTMYYAAPEQVGYGMKASSAKTDIYAVGVLLNRMITGKLPKEEPVRGELWTVIEKCISLDAKQRYTASELVDVLDKHLRGKYAREENE